MTHICVFLCAVIANIKDKQSGALEIKDQNVQVCFHKFPNWSHSLYLKQSNLFTHRLNTIIEINHLCLYNRKS